MHQLAEQALPDIITRYLAGESLQSISPDYKVATRTLYRWMLGGLGDKQYHDIVSACLIQRVADADQDLSMASDACQIARARETAKFARMDLERRRPHLYGQRVEHIGHVSPTLNITVVQPEGRVIEHDKPLISHD